MTTQQQAPQRGDIIRFSLSPTAGREQQGEARPCLVLTDQAFNRATKMAFVVPISNSSHNGGLEVNLQEKGLTKTTGHVLCGQIRSIGWQERMVKHEETAPEELVKAVTEVLADILEID